MKNFYFVTSLAGFIGAIAIMAKAYSVDFPPLAIVAVLYAIYGACACTAYGREVRKEYANDCARLRNVTF